jgi:hypothetical protein
MTNQFVDADRVGVDKATDGDGEELVLVVDVDAVDLGLVHAVRVNGRALHLHRDARRLRPAGLRINDSALIKCAFSFACCGLGR